MKSHTPYLVAHRGARTEAPENTRAAFDKALSYSIHGIELDVQLTSDGIAVVYHDWTLYRINRRRKRVSDFTYKTLCRFDWGGWFSNDYAGEKLLRLEDVLKLYAGRTRLMIEIKSGKKGQASGRSIQLTDTVLGNCMNPKFRSHRKNLYILSFDSRVLRHAFQKVSGIKYIQNLPEKPWTANFFRRGRYGIVTDHLDGICIKERYLTPALVSWAHERGLKVMTYTCNLAYQVKRAVALGVDVIMTDKPGWLMEHRNMV